MIAFQFVLENGGQDAVIYKYDFKKGSNAIRNDFGDVNWYIQYLMTKVLWNVMTCSVKRLIVTCQNRSFKRKRSACG